MYAINHEFGFSKQNVNAKVLSSGEKGLFDFLKSAYIGLRQGPVVSDLFHVMNPDEILAFCAGWEKAVSSHDESFLSSPKNFYSSMVSLGWSKFPFALGYVRRLDGRNLFSRTKGDLAERVSEIFDCRPRVREILSSGDRAVEFSYGPQKESLVCDMSSKGPANRAKIAGAIVKILRVKFEKSREHRPLDFLLNDMRAASFSGKCDSYVEDSMTDRLPIMLDNLPDDDSFVKEYRFLHDKLYNSAKPSSQRTMFGGFSDPKNLGH